MHDCALINKVKIAIINDNVQCQSKDNILLNMIIIIIILCTENKMIFKTFMGHYN